MYSDKMKRLIAGILEVHRNGYYEGATDHSGASIDAMSVILSIASHDRYFNNKVAADLVHEINEFDIANGEAVTKYAKPLTKAARNFAYNAIKKIARK